MKVTHRDKQFASQRVLTAEQARRNAADEFRRRQLDAAIRRLLKLATQPSEPLANRFANGASLPVESEIVENPEPLPEIPPVEATEISEESSCRMKAGRP